MMVDIRKKAQRLFENEVSCRETTSSFDCKLSKRGPLPALAEIENLFAAVSGRDQMTIRFGNIFKDIVLEAGDVREHYESFALGVSGDDETYIHIEIRKSMVDNVLSVYCLAEFLAFLTDPDLDAGTRLERWNHIAFRAQGRTAFEVFDEKADFQTGAFIFTNRAEAFDPGKEAREKRMKTAGDVCVFMDRREIRLLPGDFAVKSSDNADGHFGRLAASMRQLDTIMSLLYLPANSRIDKDEIIIAVTQGAKEFHFPIDEIGENEAITGLVSWILSGEDALERAGIARNTISLLCRDEEQLLRADASLVDAVNSNDKLFRRKNVDRYIEVKKQLNESILDAAKKVEELIGTLLDGFKTNFIAVITVLITEVLADHIDLAKIGNSEFVDVKFRAVVTIFIAASFVYLACTLVNIFFKWDFYRRYFRQMRESFSGLLDGKELAEENRKADAIKKSADCRLMLYCAVMTALWLALLAVVWYVGSRL